MDDDFNFLRYLDFSTSSSSSLHQQQPQQQQPQPHSAASATFGFHSNGSTASSYASPQDKSTGSSEWSVSSPSGSSASYTKSPLFGDINSIPSLFDSSFSWDAVNDINSSSSSNAASNVYNAPSSMASSYPPSNTSGNSPPFDLSIYGPSAATSNHDLANATNSSNTSFTANGSNVYGNIPQPALPSNGLTQQWQQLLLQQAQLQLQMQLQTGNMPIANVQQPQQQQQQQYPTMQVSPVPPQQPQFGMPFPQMLQQSGQNVNNTQNSQQMQQPAQFHLSTEDWSSRVPSHNDQTQSVPLNIQPTPSPNAMHGGQSQSIPSVFAPMQPQQYQFQAQRSLSPTELPPSTMSQQAKPIAALPKRDSMSIAVMPTGAAQHVTSVKNTKIAKTGLKRSYQQVKQEDNSDEDNKRSAPTLSRSASAETNIGNSSSGNGENDGKTEKKTPGGHNAVEQKYRRGINDSLITLREIVPALRHLRALPGMENAQRKQSQFSLSASVTPAAPTGFVDGVMAPTKLSKQLILVTATDYIKFLQNRRIELEGELECYKTAIRDCVEDAQVVFGLAESRWSPVRQAILRDREDIYYSRIASKEQSKKQAKLQRQKNSGNKKSDAGNADESAIGVPSDDDDDDEDDEDEDMDDGDNQGLSSAVSSKGQAKPRARKPANNKKASSPRKKANTNSTAPSRPSSNDSSKALMSVFAGVSFVGGAGYDILFGSSASAAAQNAGETVSPSQVWSRGNILRRGVTTPITVEQDLPALQAFFLHRPALLSGLVMLSVAVILGYIFFNLLPAIWNHINGSAHEAKKARARATLVQKTKLPPSVSTEEERKALALLSGAPSGSILQILALPLLLSNFFINLFTENVPFQFVEAEDEISDLEELASALRFLEMCNDHQVAYMTRMVAFLNLYNITHSLAWPASKTSIPLIARAQAVLAFSWIDLFGSRLSRQAASMWKNAQDLLKKEDMTAGWLRFALSSSFEEARQAVEGLLDINPIYQVAEIRAQAILMQAWPAVFTEVISATTFSQTSGTPPSAPTSSNSRNTAQVDEILASMPPSSPSYALALLSKGIQALGQNDKATALKVALHLAPAHSQSLASVRAYSSLVSGRPEAASIEEASGAVDTLAYSTITWLSIRQIAKISLSTTPSKGDAESEAEESGNADEAGLQVATIRLRKLLATEVFSSNVDGGFMDAQDKCVEQLVNIGRLAAGLDALSDSGCEL